MASAGSDRHASTAEREFTLTRLFEAPRPLVWEAWTRPEHIEKWFGPDGFTTRNIAMDVRPGGLWRFTMTGPDGTVFRDRAEYLEVVPAERLVYWHGNDKDDDPERFHVTVTFADEAGGTRVTMRGVFSTVEQFEQVKKFGALESGQQTLRHLAEHLAVLMHGGAFELTREFDAPRELVWKVFTEPKHLAAWWGPKGFKMLQLAVDLRPGGLFHYGMQAPDGSVMWGKWVFREVVPPERLTILTSFSDEQGGYSRHPLAPEWPLEMLSVMTLSEDSGRTTLHMVTTAYNASAVERSTFEAGFESMKVGFGGTFDQLTAYLATLRS